MVTLNKDDDKARIRKRSLSVSIRLVELLNGQKIVGHMEDMEGIIMVYYPRIFHIQMVKDSSPEGGQSVRFGFVKPWEPLIKCSLDYMILHRGGIAYEYPIDETENSTWLKDYKASTSSLLQPTQPLKF